jgi:CheY-like chemotaxis protein
MGTMTVFVLIVEDEADFIDELRQVFAELPGSNDLKVARSRSAAFDLLKNEFFDLIVLDLNIPTIDDALDADPEHGHAVFARARSVAPGTPIFVLTGSPAEDFIPEMLRQQQQVDIWSEGQKVGTIVFLKKSNFDECSAMLEPIVFAINALSDVELDRGGANLTLQDDRLVRIFAKKFGGTRCLVSSLSGGLSGTKVIRLCVTDSGGALVHDAVAKLGSPVDIRAEGDRFDNQVVRLDPRATPRKLATLDFGAGAVAGVFYGLAEGFEASAFEIARHQDGRCARAIKSIEAVTKRWTDGVSQTRRTIRDVRQRLLSDDELARVIGQYPINWVTDFETSQIQTRWACIHGDLHGSNVLISSDGSAVLIDYGDVGNGPASLDPVTLELSLLFHPQRLDMAGWPSIDQARQWGSIDAYLERCPAAEFIHECREWAARVSAGNREIAASAYSYLIRQLKYDDTNKDLALALLQGVKSFYDAT